MARALWGIYGVAVIEGKGRRRVWRSAAARGCGSCGASWSMHVVHAASWALCTACTAVCYMGNWLAA